MPRRRQHEPPIYTFRVRVLGGYYVPSKTAAVWRDIEIAANQTLADLGETIPLAFDFTDPHLWSFFLSGKAWDRATEYALRSDAGMMDGPRSRAAGRVQIRDVPFPGVTGKKEFLFLFDYGDEWHFGVKLRRVSEQAEPGARYPRIVAQQGKAPPQYPNLEEDDWDETDDA
jgi:hypothetical protein